MDKKQSEELTDSLKSAMLHDASQWSLENRERLHRSRRNLMAFAALTIFAAITGASTNNVEFMIFKFDDVPTFWFYLFLAFINLYLYWSYQNIHILSQFSRKMVDYIYENIIGFDYRNVASNMYSEFNMRSYNAWRIMSPLIACAIAVVSCAVRIATDMKLPPLIFD